MFLVTETWLRPEENGLFSELLPPEYLFFNSPRLTGKGGGLVSVFKQILKCRRIPFKIYPSFEILPFIWTQYHPTFCAVIYRPPKSKDFINDFGDFLSTYVPQFDYFLICGDFNIYVESPVEQLANDFNALLDAFDLSQSVQLPTHQRGGTLDLVISRGLVVSIKDVFDLAISDHSVICFEVQGPEFAVDLRAPLQSRRMITTSTSSDFAAAFLASGLHSTGIQQALSSPETFLFEFNSTCVRIMDAIAPARRKRPRSTYQPWLNDVTHAHRRHCRQAERRWRKDGLQVSLGILRDTRLAYQRAVSAAKSNIYPTLSLKIHISLEYCLKPSMQLLIPPMLYFVRPQVLSVMSF